MTPAEKVALTQVLSSGQQSLILNARGMAIGGQFSSTDLSSNIGNLGVPQGVTGYLNFSQQNSLSLSGNLLNNGSLYAFSSNPGNATGSISANNIVNYANALISSNLNSAFASSTGALPNFNLILHAVNNITNHGVISSSGSLTLSAGSSLINTPQTLTQTTQTLIQAQNNLNIITSSIINSGNLTSLASNINVSSSLQKLDFNNNSGVVSAILGDINVSNLSSSALASLNLQGGNFYSQSLNLSAASGAVEANLGDVSGWINVNACKANVGAATDNLKLGNLNITGDPTFFNSAGTLTLSNLSNTSGNALALIASHDVIVSAGTIDTTNPLGGNGGNLTIIAGANITGGSSGSNDTTTTLTITGPSATGGAIDTSGVSSINTSGTLTTTNHGGNGGNVFIAAFSGTKSGTLDPGTVNLGSSGYINTAGGGSDFTSSGRVTVMAGATADPASGVAIVLPAIYTATDPVYSQSSSSGGNVTISTATPVVSGTVTILNGAMGGTGSITAGTTQNTSVSIASRGGGASIEVQPTLAQWQIDIITQALNIVNAQRLAEDPSLPALQYSAGLSAVASQQASYLAQTGHLGHFSTLGETPTNRATVIGLSTSGCCAENAGFASGYTILDGFNVVNDMMFAEPNTSGTHHFNLVGTSASHNNYAGFGFATNGSSMYFVTDFSRNDPGAGKTNINSTPILGGLGGAPGNTPVPPVVSGSNNTVRAIGANNYLPTSIISNGNVSITAGKDLTATGSIITNGQNGIQSSSGSPRNATNAGNISITAGNNVSLFNLQAGGGIGATSNSANKGAGGAGGSINVSSSNGSISILPLNTACSPCIAVAAQGGAGGAAMASGLSGGKGGDGGTVTLTANNGNINLTAIEVGGGGGAGGAGGSTGGAGGAGGKGGNITLSASTITIQDYISASGGGGGGAGASGSIAGGGGGGGAYGMPGFGGTSNSTSAGGGGAGGGLVGAFGGPRTSSMIAELRNGNGASGGVSAPGGSVGIIGGGGGGGTGSSGTGGSGGDMGAAGSGSGAIAGGAAGAGGSISITAKTAVVQSTVSGFFGSLSATNGTSSVLSAGTNGAVTISTNEGSVSAASTYSSLADYSSGTRTESLLVSAGFEVGSTKGGNGSSGGILAGSQANSITINGTGNSGSLSSGIFFSNGTASVTIIENSLPVVFSGTAKVTPAELIAINQVLLGGGQTIVLDANGAAVGGSLSINSGNIPAGGFTKLVLPPSVTLTDSVAELSFSDSVTINGSFLYAGSNGTATITTPLFINNGTVSPTGGATNLLIQSTAGSNLEIGGNGTTSAPGSLSFTASGGALNITGNVHVNSPSVTINAGDAVGIAPSASFTLNTGNVLSVNTGLIFNSAGFLGGTQNFNLAPAGSAIGTIANSNGDVILAANQFINSAGKSVLIIASGNIIGSKLSSINLSNTKGKGGSLIALAGFSFTPATIGQITDLNQLFTVSSVSATGGSINLAKTSINTSSTFKSATNSDAGSITLLGNAVAGGNSGVVVTGAINASSVSGKGGTFRVFAPGGATINGAINTKGASGGGAVLLSAAPYTNGSIQVLGGFLSPSANLQAASPADGAAASILINGTVSSSSSNGAGGAVTLSADSFIQVNGAIDSSARTSGGAITINSLNGTVSLANLNSSGLAGSSTLTTGSAGNISVSASSFISIKGNLSASGGSTSIARQNAGSGANISLQTSNRDSLSGFYVGNISVSGYLSSAGGNALAKTSGGKGGNAGAIDLKAGYLQVKGKSGANSIIASAGSGFAGKGSSGSVSLSTYATQAIPTNFDLLSKVASEYALPGGVFNVGAGSAVVNGTAGSIVSGTDTFSISNAAALSKSSNVQGRLSVTIGGGAQQLDYEGQQVSTASLTGNIRTKVTPAAALALYQLALGQTQTIGLNSDGSLSPQNPQSKISSITIPGYDLPRTFSKFVLQAAGSPSEAGDIQLTISGQSSQLNIPSSTIAGSLTFTGTLNSLNVGTGNLTLLSTASINSSGNLIFSGTTLNNAGQITASQMELIRPAAASNIINNGGHFNVTQLALPTFHTPSTLNISESNGGAFSALVQFVSSELPSAAASNANVPEASNSKPATINFNLPGSSSTVSGTYVSSGKLSLNGQSVLINGVSTPTGIALSALTANKLSSGFSLSTAGAVPVTNTTINTGAGSISFKASNLTIASTSNLSGSTFTSTSAAITVDGKITGQKGLSISTGFDTTLGAGSSLSVPNGAIKITAKGNVSLGGSLSAGVLNGSPGFIRLSTTDVLSKGSISVTGGSLTLGTAQTITANGGNINLSTTAGNADLGQNNSLQANGGNIVILSISKIQGATGNQFWASSLGGTAQAGGGTGGGIELGAGVKVSALASSSKLASGTVSGNFASNFNVANQSNKSGVVNTNISNSGSVNLSSSGNNQASMNLQGGTILFDSNGSGNTVSLDGATFNVTAFKPIGYSENRFTNSLELTRSGEKRLDNENDNFVFARVFLPGFKNSQTLETKTFSNKAYRACLEFKRGDLFVCPELEMRIETELASIMLKKGALSAISLHNGILRVTNCSNNGDVRLNLGGQNIEVCPGEEFLISASGISDKSAQAQDGIGRRELKHHGKIAGLHLASSEVSLLTLITQTEHLQALRNPVQPFEQKTQSRLLKTASAINVLRANHGAYRASN